MDLTVLLVPIFASVIIIAPILWLTGRAFIGKDNAKFTDATMIVVLETAVGAMVGAFVRSLATLIMFIAWLALIKHFFDCGWLKALAIAIVAAGVFVVIVVVLAVLGFGILKLLL